MSLSFVRRRASSSSCSTKGCKPGRPMTADQPSEPTTCSRARSACPRTISAIRGSPAPTSLPRIFSWIRWRPVVSNAHTGPSAPFGHQRKSGKKRRESPTLNGSGRWYPSPASPFRSHTPLSRLSIDRANASSSLLKFVSRTCPHELKRRAPSYDVLVLVAAAPSRGRRHKTRSGLRCRAHRTVHRDRCRPSCGPILTEQSMTCRR